MSSLSRDFFMTCSTRAAARALSNQGVPTYLYLFLYPPVLDPMNDSSYCKGEVCHGAELGFVFHSSAFAGFPFANEAEVNLSWNVLQYWSSFAHSSPLKNPITWPRYSSTSDEALALNIPIATVTNYSSPQCDFWDSYILQKEKKP